MNRGEYYTSVFLDLLLIIFFIIAIASIIYPKSIWFVLAALSPLVFFIFYLFPFIIVPSILKSLSLIVGQLSNNGDRVKTIGYMKSCRIVKTKDYMDDPIANKITSIFETLILILLIIYSVLAIYYGIPIGDSSMW